MLLRMTKPEEMTQIILEAEAEEGVEAEDKPMKKEKNLMRLRSKEGSRAKERKENLNLTRMIGQRSSKKTSLRSSSRKISQLSRRKKRW